MAEIANNELKILIAIPKGWGEYDWKSLQNTLEGHGASLILANNSGEAAQIIKAQKLKGVMISVEWLFARDKEILKLMERDIAGTPVIFVVEKENFNDFFDWYNKHYLPSEEYVHVPFDLDEMLLRMKHIKMIE